MYLPDIYTIEIVALFVLPIESSRGRQIYGRRRRQYVSEVGGIVQLRNSGVSNDLVREWEESEIGFYISRACTRGPMLLPASQAVFFRSKSGERKSGERRSEGHEKYENIKRISESCSLRNPRLVIS
jgi:hypothetical protein